MNSCEIYIILRRSESQGTHGIHQEPDIPPGAGVLRQQLPDEAQEVRDRRGTRPHGETGMYLFTKLHHKIVVQDDLQLFYFFCR